MWNYANIETSLPAPPFNGSLSPSLPEREGRTYSLNNRLLVSPLPSEGDGGGFHLEGGGRGHFCVIILSTMSSVEHMASLPMLVRLWML